MMLVLEIEYLTGGVFAAHSPDSNVPDWPPQPDRIFSALVATWGARGEQDAEGDALKWLEDQPEPRITASGADSRTAPVSFVPPNDPKTGQLGDRAVLPIFRRRQPRRFPAARPHDPIVRFYWSGVAPDEDKFASLSQLAADTSYVGHSASLTRCRFLRCESAPPTDAEQPRRGIYKGRFDELCDSYKLFVESRGKVGRPQPGAQVIRTSKSEGTALQSYFSPEWLVLEHIGGEMPDIRAAALLAKEIRDTLLSGYRQIGMADRIPAVVSGHTPDGNPTREPHLSIVPLAFAGHTYADGHVLGFALIPPRNSGLLENNDFLRAMRSIAPFDSEEERRTLQWDTPKETLRLRRFGLKLSPTLDPGKKSLDSSAYTKPAFTFGTVTPIVLDRHLKEEGAVRQEEIISQIKSACVNAGLPEPDVIVPDKHSAIEGAPSAQPSGKAPEWMRWRLPSSLASRFLTHAVIRFSEPVEGPVILGAGRFVGLGLCRPIVHAEDLA
jgi:CRISPR-associated protein Csb2